MVAPYLTLSAPAAPASVRKLRTAAGRAVAELAASERVADDVRLCVSEAVSNVVRHAYGNRGGEVEVVVERVDDGEIEVVVRDTGVGIARTKRRGVGGYGLKIIERLARRTTISSKPSTGTEVRMAFDVDGDIGHAREQRAA
jgi:stage II sporulation protein AB (anti-sigma F factor)